MGEACFDPSRLKPQIHHPLHLPTFLSQYNKFWTIDAEHQKAVVHARWLAMLYIVLCLGAHFGDDDSPPEREKSLLMASGVMTRRSELIRRRVRTVCRMPTFSTNPRSKPCKLSSA